MDQRLSAPTDARATVPAEWASDFCNADFGPAVALCGDADAPARAGTPLNIDLMTLARFKALMADEGWPVQIARMVFDRVYAHERVAFGHTSANQALRSLALDIFRSMHASDGLSH